jgi:hypothetical protein
MTNEELHVLAAAGLRERIATMQAELTVYHEEFPELFVSATPPQLLKAHANGNGHGPDWIAPAAIPMNEPAAPARRRSAKSAKKAAPVDGRTTSWTPERRAKHSRAIRRAKRAANA